jgi:hypothetical protein
LQAGLAKSLTIVVGKSDAQKRIAGSLTSAADAGQSIDPELILQTAQVVPQDIDCYYHK